MNIKIKSYLKHINIKLSSQEKKKKNIKIKLFITRNINRYISIVFLILKRNILGVSVERYEIDHFTS